MNLLRLASVVCLAGLASGVAAADEGMWLVNKPPVKLLKDTYKFEPTQDWLTKMQRSVVRFQTGGSGSIVSKNGLVMTNHHVGSDMLLKLSTAENDLLEHGFNARTPAAELKCPDLELNLLWEIRDVTDLVKDSVKPGMTVADSGAAKRKAIDDLEKSEGSKSKMKAQVVTLFQGGQYHLYLYKAYTDIRLVFAPDEQIAFFGGDTDNFEFPRYNLDCCFFRIYENGKPLDTPANHLMWSASGAAENELVLVFGHPGRTRRGYTVDHLRFLRDVQLPDTMKNAWRRESKLQTFAGRSAENARVVRDDLHAVANGRKVYTGMISGLQDPQIFAGKIAAESELRSNVAADPLQEQQWAGAWQAISDTAKIHATFYVEREALDRFKFSSHFQRASTIVRLASELSKPSNERLSDFGDSKLDSVYLNLYSTEQVSEAIEIEKLTQAISNLVETLGGEHPIVKGVLTGKSPSARAVEVITGTKLKTSEARREMVAGGQKAITASTDPLIQIVMAVEPRWRELRRLFEDKVDAVERENYSKIAAAKFAKFGDTVYPDATFTLRMSFGRVQGLAKDATPAFTDLAGVFTRAEARKGEAVFELPKIWWDARSKLNLKTPFNFTCTADIIGGNSGSPAVNTKGEVVGLIFDGNIYSTVGDVMFDTENSRAISVDSRGLIEALKVVYGANELVSELTEK